MKAIVRLLAALAILSCMAVPAAYSQTSSPQPPAAASQASADNKENKSAESQKSGQSSPDHGPEFGKDLARETREAEGEEENASLKHSPVVRKFARATGLSVHAAHMLALWVNFGIIVAVLVWAGVKMIPSILRSRSAGIQKAIEEARAASQEANRRLADIENRLKQMDVDIGKMQAAADKEAEVEEARIQKAAEEEMRKIIEAAKQDIAAAEKQARRELSTHTADLAIALARKHIHVDSNTDQVLVQDFAARLAGNSPARGNGGQRDPGKDGQ